MKLFLYSKLNFFGIELFWHLTVSKQKLHFYQTELLKIELFD